ncbi:epoxide hydrolase (plasmid) [Rhodococcus erythropolis]|uniref:epoxide hydrolase family protein n=1 Tax=Rhodococcus erythropolis TaxID=1833 RepID=UPI00061B6809|nr:epoxide hydrolase family protein [Rhodococcus erythropolis]AKE01116.1 epoxide hydrolase [Rhodococcus erythropolis]
MTKTNANDIRPFRIDISQQQLDDLNTRLEATRWPDEITDAGWDYGTPLSYLRDLAQYWRTTYDWRSHEAKLNDFPQFVTEIDSTTVHFLHVRSPEADATPLILTHGWPGSIVEFIKIIGPLSDPRSHGGDPADAFHLVIPSIPGFGFSGPTHERGWSPNRIAKAWAELMSRLGYDRYAAQGGDLGALVTPELGRVAPQALIGIHLNAASLGFTPLGPPSDDDIAQLADTDMAKLGAMKEFQDTGTGYQAIQSTRPQTLSYGLTDSPVGQLAWIIEKFKEWSNPGAVLPDDAIERDLLLTNVSIYWLTATGGSAGRVYYEGRVYYSAGGGMPLTNSGVPTAVANFAGDTAIRYFGEQANTIARWNEYGTGGHFAALEAPEVLVEDMREYFRTLR